MSSELKVYISVDMEGITGVTRFEDVEVGKPRYEHFRQLMIHETNAAIEGALAAGATQIVVRDAHDSACNLLPEELHRAALLISNWSGGVLGMMECLDSSFAAAVFIGNHAKANTPNAILKHTMSLSISDLRVNGVSLSEAGWNALIAGYYGVPVVFVSGDKAVCEHCQSLFPSVYTVAVKEAVGAASVNLHPAVAQEMIRAGVEQAVRERAKCRPFVLSGGYTVEIEFTKEEKAYRAQWYPGAERVNERTVRFRSGDFFACLRFFDFVS